MFDSHPSLLSLLQLTSSALPIGAYNYSEGIETLVEQGVINNPDTLQAWLSYELNHGSIAVEAAVMLRGYRCLKTGDLKGLKYWNQWLSAQRETAELQKQSWQMGDSLLRLIGELETTDNWSELLPNCNYAIAFSLGAFLWQLPENPALLGYLHSWASNLITAGIKLIPLGQTAGQKILKNLHPQIIFHSQTIQHLGDDQLFTSNWGLALASMTHEHQYTRLFRS